MFKAHEGDVIHPFLRGCLMVVAYGLVLVLPVLFLGALLARVVCWMFGIETEFD